MPRWTRTAAPVASPASLLAARGARFIPRLIQAACVSLLAVPAIAAPSYRISFERSGYGLHGSGVLAGLTSPDLDFPFVLAGTFPVGTALDVHIRVFGVEFDGRIASQHIVRMR